MNNGSNGGTTILLICIQTCIQWNLTFCCQNYYWCYKSEQSENCAPCLQAKIYDYIYDDDGQSITFEKLKQYSPTSAFR